MLQNGFKIGWRQRVRNEELYGRIHLRETLLQKVIRRKFRLFGHVCRMDKDRKIRDIMFWIVEGTNKKGSYTERGSATLSNGIRKPLYTGFIELHKLETSGLLLSTRRQAPTGVGPIVKGKKVKVSPMYDPVHWGSAR